MSVFSGFLCGACGRSCRRSLSRFLFRAMIMCIDIKNLLLSSFFGFFNNVYIHHNLHHCLHSRPLSVTVSLLQIYSVFPFRWCESRGYFHTIVHQIFGGISASYPTEARHVSPVREEIPKMGRSYRDTVCYRS